MAHAARSAIQFDPLSPIFELGTQYALLFLSFLKLLEVSENYQYLIQESTQYTWFKVLELGWDISIKPLIKRCLDNRQETNV